MTPAQRTLRGGIGLTAAWFLAACAQQPVRPTPPPVVVTPPAPLPAPAAATPPPALPVTATSVAPTAEQTVQFQSCVNGLRPGFVAAGIQPAVFDQHVAGVQPDLSVLPLLDRQPEFSTPIWDYLAGLVDDERVADGKALLAQHAGILREVEQRYGVDAATVVAVWGVESNFGRVMGKRPLLVSLSTLSCFGRRQAFFRGELLELLRIVQRGDIAAANLNGSWAGAFGQTQFMPSTFNRIAVDGDGDGRRDLVGSTADALASTANYLARSGWRTGQPWGYEVRVPAGFDAGKAGRRNRQPLSTWQALGVTRVDGRGFDLPSDTPSAVVLPAGASGPAFLVFKNYDAIYSYNAAESYAFAIALLADRLRGGAGLQTPWPTDDPGLSRAERRELQSLLIARGHALGAPDGVLGSSSRAAIQQEQQRLGHLPADGRGGQKLLRALRAGQ